MASWSKRFVPSGGRYSPFAALPPGGPPPTVTEDDYHYLGPDDLIDPPRHQQIHPYGLPSTTSSRVATNTPAPDILVLKHRGTTYPLHFPAFSIAEGILKVGEVRRMAAKETGAEDRRRVKLLYKGNILKDDARPCRDERLKQNSEVLCIVSEGYGRGEEGDSSSSADSEEMLENGIGSNPVPRVEVDGTITGGPQRVKRKGHRGGRTRRKGTRDSSPTGNPARTSDYLAPEATYTTSSTSINNPPRPASRASSPMRPLPTQSQPQPVQQPQQPTTLPPLSQTTTRSSSPLAKLDEISRTFHTKFVPQCVQFTANPPTDPKTRDFEYKKLSESLLAQVILKLDAVETEGDEGARARRKDLVRETQNLLNGLDAVGKKGA
ncbi:hypothetical protein MMC12_007116 [Toensbergia leucococca]|nr:hypothetical protein [Toensbergia leucococca]